MPADRTVIVPDSGKAMIRMASNYRTAVQPQNDRCHGQCRQDDDEGVLLRGALRLRQDPQDRGNQNNDIGVPNTLFRLTDDTEYAVVEMGMDHAGEIERLTRCARPSAGIITMIGVSHLEISARARIY